MTTEEFYAPALLAAFRSQATNNLLSAPKKNEVVSLANDLAISRLAWRPGLFFTPRVADGISAQTPARLVGSTGDCSAWPAFR
jgi:hypothetical protein